MAGIPRTGEWCENELEINSITDNSKEVLPGGLFAALAGPERDGHDFIPEALARGAAAVLCQRQPEGPGPWITVSDSREAWGKMCANWFGRPGERMTLVAVTGTNGKTTTTSLLHELISGVTGEKVGLIGPTATSSERWNFPQLPLPRTAIPSIPCCAGWPMPGAGMW